MVKWDVWNVNLDFRLTSANITIYFHQLILKEKQNSMSTVYSQQYSEDPSIYKD